MSGCLCHQERNSARIGITVVAFLHFSTLSSPPFRDYIASLQRIHSVCQAACVSRSPPRPVICITVVVDHASPSPSLS